MMIRQKDFLRVWRKRTQLINKTENKLIRGKFVFIKMISLTNVHFDFCMIIKTCFDKDFLLGRKKRSTDALKIIYLKLISILFCHLIH